jgi:hypothetical protein
VEKQAGAVNKPFRIETVRGKPYEVAGRRLVPVARITSLGKGRATIGLDHAQGWAGGYAQILPLVVVDETEQRPQYITITDATQSMLRRILVRAMVVLVLLAALRRLAQKARR